MRLTLPNLPDLLRRYRAGGRHSQAARNQRTVPIRLPVATGRIRATATVATQEAPPTAPPQPVVDRLPRHRRANVRGYTPPHGVDPISLH